MSKTKYDLTDASRKRIESRLVEILKTPEGRERSMHRTVETLMDAIEPENFYRPREICQALVISWIREDNVKGYLRRVASEYVGRLWSDYEEKRKHSRDLIASFAGLARAGKHGL